jgi:D-alanyl-D-alanine carboxypeptidase|tara:strand:+ start:154788 stop:155825 length:1038 start_codon:yes stop_codon:yes gene_type:complete
MKKRKRHNFSLSSLFFAAAFSFSVGISHDADAAFQRPKIGESTPQSMLVFDAESREVYHAHNPKKPWITASLNKAMALHLFFEHIKAEGANPHKSTIKISSGAAGYLRGYSASTLDVVSGESISYDLAARSIIAKSAGDVAYAIAEHVSGSHTEFVTLMNKTAQDWGMKDTNFTDASGFSKRPRRGKPRAYSKSTSCDMAVMMQNIITRNPSLYKEYFSATSYTHHGKTKAPKRLFTNFYEHAEGQKSGYLNVSRNNLVASATLGNTRMIGVALGTYWRPDSNQNMADKFNDAFTEKALMRTSTSVVLSSANMTVSYSNEDLNFDGRAPLSETSAPRPTLSQICK